ncbi:MAG: DUF1501 domain-containing protein [Pseudomonadota bacterium]|nr:DUF1501 domain-containing protein [Pseudomonadota bacterium]
MKLTRRELIIQLRNLLGTASIYPLLPSSLLAQPSNDEHFFIFVELKGGAHYAIATDCPDPNKLPNNQDIFMTLPLKATGELDTSKLTLTAKQKEFILVPSHGEEEEPDMSDLPFAYHTDSYFAALPERFAGGTTNAGYDYHLGWSGTPLKDLTDTVSVVRGVSMQGTFHGPANLEIFSGFSDGSKPHVAGVIASHLQKRAGGGTLPLDNLVLDGAAYVSSENSLRAIKLPSRAIAQVLANLRGNNLDLQHAKHVLESIDHRDKLSVKQNSIINAYLAAFGDYDVLKDKLQHTGIDKDLSNNHIKQQLDACAAMFKNNLARVVTICTGTNGVFGNFDAHGNLYGGGDFLPMHSKLLQDTLAGIAEFISDLEADNTLKGKVTLVISADYGRNSNFAGNQVRPTASTTDLTPLKYLGNGHFFQNNNYTLYGKGIKGGVWMGESDPVTRHPYCVNLTKLHRATTGVEVARAFEDPYQSRPTTAGHKLKTKNDYSTQVDASPVTEQVESAVAHKRGHEKEIRALMAKDIVRTLTTCAGMTSDEYQEHYGEDERADIPANTIKQLLAKK